MTLVAGWHLQKLEASIKLTLTDLRGIWDSGFRDSKTFYFSSRSLPGATSKISDGTGKEWRLTVSFGNTMYFSIDVKRHASSNVKITGGSLIVQGTDFPVKTLSPEDGAEVECARTDWLEIPDGDVQVSFNVVYVQPSEGEGIVYCELPAEQRLLSQMSDSYENLLLNGEDMDITFNVDGQQIKAHKLILAARVPYFAKMFASGMVEAQSHHVDIPDAEPGAFRAVLKHIYCGKLPVDLETAAPKILPLADKYGLSILYEACVHWMEESITPDNVCATLVTADLYRCAGLKKKCLECMSQWKASMDDGMWEALADHPRLLIDLVRID